MLLCISGQGLITVHAPKPPVTQKSPSVLTIILRFLFCLPRLLYEAIKSPQNSFAHPFRTPISNIANTSSGDPENSDNEHTFIPETSTYPNNKTAEHSNPLITSPVSCATASPNEFDINNETRKEGWHFANQITYPLRIQIARGYLEGKMYRERLNEDIIALRELESRAWEEGVVDSEGEVYWDAGGGDDDERVENLLGV